MTSLLQAIPHVVHLKGSASHRTVCLQQNLLERFEALLQSQDERPVYHLLSGFSGPLKNRKQLMKEESLHQQNFKVDSSNKRMSG
jgi:hypothetical protein